MKQSLGITLRKEQPNRFNVRSEHTTRTGHKERVRLVIKVITVQKQTWRNRFHVKLVSIVRLEVRLVVKFIWNTVQYQLGVVQILTRPCDNGFCLLFWRLPTLPPLITAKENYFFWGEFSQMEKYTLISVFFLWTKSVILGRSQTLTDPLLVKVFYFRLFLLFLYR